MSQENVHWELFLCVCPPRPLLFLSLVPYAACAACSGPFSSPSSFFSAPSSSSSVLPSLSFPVCRAGGLRSFAPHGSRPPSVPPSAVFLCENFCFLNLLSSSALRVLSVFFRPVGLKKVSKRFGDTEKSSTFAIPFEKWASLSGRWFCEKSASAMLQRVFFGNFPGLRASGKFFLKKVLENQKKSLPLQPRFKRERNSKFIEKTEKYKYKQVPRIQ